MLLRVAENSRSSLLMCGLIYSYLEITVAIKYDSDYEIFADVQPVIFCVMGLVGVSNLQAIRIPPSPA
jgi:hypothetical protein